MLDGRRIEWGEFEGAQWKRDIETGVVLKRRVSDRERGVVFISFEYEWSRLMQVPNLKEFARSYRLVLSPSWSPPHCLETTLFPALYPDRILSLISHLEDMRTLPRLSEKMVAVELFASSWVNPDGYTPVPFARKDIDLVVLANFSPYKRHFALFRALREMPREVRVVLVGRPLGDRTAAVIRKEAAAYGVADRFELMEDASDATLAEMLARAKTSAIFSRQEGSCVAVVESMFANTPVGLYADAHIGSRTFINPSTGRFFEHDHLSGQLMEFIASAERYSPRQWAIKNDISCWGSTATLNQALRAEALAAGEEWTEDIAVHHWRPNPELLLPADRERLRPALQDIEDRFGMRLGKPFRKQAGRGAEILQA